ncbi:MAG: hypothetical protein WBF05_14775, partial [Anaerolineales bacterium]
PNDHWHIVYCNITSTLYRVLAQNKEVFGIKYQVLGVDMKRSLCQLLLGAVFFIISMGFAGCDLEVSVPET